MFGQAQSLPRDDAAGFAASTALPLRLLVIDDDDLHRMIICRTGAKAGFVPAGSDSYEEAADLVQHTAFDCITLDLSLGEHAGVEMLRHLWTIGSKVPVIIVSGCDDATCRETLSVAKSLNLNIWEAVHKPVDLAMLRESLERLRARSDAERDSKAES